MLFVIGELLAAHSQAQSPTTTKTDKVTALFRTYEDDDFINFWGHGTDNAYTNGSRIDYFYQPVHRPHGILGRHALRAGDSTIDIYSWGVMEIMYTPDDLTIKEWQPNDYQYAGALVATHALYSYNPEKKYDIQTEIVFGIIGPAALGKEFQAQFHRMINYIVPQGWGHQYRNDALLNLNLTAEKEVFSAGNGLKVLAGGQVYAGTMQNGAAVYPLVLIGKMNPYFNGYFSQYTSTGSGRKKWQTYFMFKPELQFFLQNAMLQGGMFTHNPNLEQSKSKFHNSTTGTSQANSAPPKLPELQQWLTSFTYGFVITRGKLGFSASQHVSSAYMKNFYCHTEGNISLYFGL